MAADRFIVGYVHSIAIRLSKMQDQKSLTLRWRSVNAPLTFIFGHGCDVLLRIFA